MAGLVVCEEWQILFIFLFITLYFVLGAMIFKEFLKLLLGENRRAAQIEFFGKDEHQDGAEGADSQ